jgi:Concanavalin A-like lectin/glucanases superfamily/Abnormal spindle-like microcephaly-assoc'd, ASPM-SPD-2-Hydin
MTWLSMAVEPKFMVGTQVKTTKGASARLREREVLMRWKISVAGLVLLIVVAEGQRGQAQCVIPPSGLVSWWTGDTNESDLYSVNHPSAVKAVKLVPAEVKDGFTFGTDGHIDIPPSQSLANQKFTWDAWVKPEGPGPNNDQYGSIILQQGIDDSHVAVSLNWRATPDYRFLFIFGNVNSELIVSKNIFPPGTFYLVAGTYDGSTFRLYVNGVLEGSYSETKTIPYSSQTWEIGSSGTDSQGSGDPRTWNGIIDEVEAFNVALSAGQIHSIYKAGSAGTCKAPVLVTPTSQTFAQVVGTTSPAKTVTVINNRSASVTMDGFKFAGTDSTDFAISSTGCGSTLEARKRCNLDVTFTPHATGTRTAVLEVKDSGAGSPQTVTLSGIGALSTEVSVTPTKLSFSCTFTERWQCSSAQTVVSLTNTGGATLYIEGIATTGGGHFSQENNCGASLGAKQSCSIEVGPVPPNLCRHVTETGTLEINDTGNRSPQKVALTDHLLCHFQ